MHCGGVHTLVAVALTPDCVDNDPGTPYADSGPCGKMTRWRRMWASVGWS